MIFNGIYKKYLKWQIFIPIDFKFVSTLHVDLGSGNKLRNPFNSSKVAGSDYKIPKNKNYDSDFYTFDLTKDFPFENNSISSFSAFDVIEHIPRWERFSSEQMKFPFINFMNEVNRCLVIGGYFIAVTPAFPSTAVFQDPTHVNFITEETINYFSEFAWANNLDYEYSGNFKVIHQSWVYSNYVYDSFKERPDSLFRYYGELVINLLKILKNVYINNNRPTHLLWILQKN